MTRGLLFTLLLFISLAFTVLYAGNHQDCQFNNSVPFATNQTHLTIWNGQEYEPFFVKGMNLGVALPGKFPGELEVSREQYANWFQQIKDAGFNTIRLYTLHFPHFYEVLDSFNLENPHNPLFFFQGVWLEEELEGYEHDLYTLTETFTLEAEENVDCVHGNRIIEPRPGKAYGTYQTDVSQWNVGYIMGREIHPHEVLLTNELHANNTDFTGEHFGIHDALPAETWVVSRLDHLVQYEYNSYETMRPVSFSSWPTLDPIDHPEEWNAWEDTTSIDLGTIELLDAPAGYFASYHAYPYYPDYISYESIYQGYEDNYGPNSYLGYLTRLKEHYHRFPLIIAEYGVPSSWGKAHYATSGMHHGGFDEYEQGEKNIRMLKTIEAASLGGGMQFSWLDEWFKRTWITDHIDYLPDRRILWHNIAAPEQNFGLISFQKPLEMELWEEFGEDSHVQKMEASAAYDFLHLKIHTNELLSYPDDIWISLDTYDADLGESILPSGDTVSNRAEFALHLTNHSAHLYVTQAYDLYGIFHGISEPEQQYQSVATDGDPWRIVRWRINTFEQDVHFIGNLQVNYWFLPAQSHDAVTYHQDHIHVRLPWSLLHFVDPSEYVVFHDDRDTPQYEDTISDGVSVSVFYKGEKYTPGQRYLWDTWNTATDVQEVVKGSYWVMKDRLHEFNNRAIARCDSFFIPFDGDPHWVDADNGVLKNDFDLDGNFMQALLLDPPEYGTVELSLDGSFSYMPDYTNEGLDMFTYKVFDGYSLSAPASVYLHLDNISAIAEHSISDDSVPELTIYPNPSKGNISLDAEVHMDELVVFDMKGRMLRREAVNGYQYNTNLDGYPVGMYLVKVRAGKYNLLRKVNLTE